MRFCVPRMPRVDVALAARPYQPVTGVGQQAATAAVSRVPEADLAGSGRYLILAGPEPNSVQSELGPPMNSIVVNSFQG